MRIELECFLVEQLHDTLRAATTELAKSRERESALREEFEQNRLFSESEAQDYLRRDAETLRYYRNLGLDSFKKGKDRWYRKGEVDAWLASGKVSRNIR